MFIPAVVGIVCFALFTSETRLGDPDYYTFPMGIIGKVYANSMLALINSRMQLGSEETPSTTISAFKFASAPANNKDSTIHDVMEMSQPE
jgi:hypothetical protein